MAAEPMTHNAAHKATLPSLDIDVNSLNNFIVLYPQTLTCYWCGHTGTDVQVQEYEFMGEVRRHPECTDKIACRERYERLFQEASK